MVAHLLYGRRCNRTSKNQFEIEIYPQFRSMDEVPPEGRIIKKDNNKAQKNLNDKNARKYVERLINENFSDRDIWMTYQNVRVGIDFLSYLLKKYGTVQDALAAYNYGEKGAREHLWSNGVYVYSYNSAIMQRMKEIEEVVGK